MRRDFVLFLICSLVIGGMLVLCHHNCIDDLRNDIQAYSTRSLLPDEESGRKGDVAP